MSSIYSLPSTSKHAILHIDGDAFFASCEQARRPEWQGKVLITGKERGIAASMSYEAKALGITRAMPLWEIKKLCPQAIIIPSDYETYSLLSKRFYTIVRRFTALVEEYGVDECFADITNCHCEEEGVPMRIGTTDDVAIPSLNQNSFKTDEIIIANKILTTLKRELGFTFSAGLAPNKVLAKVGSKWKKPCGFTVINKTDALTYLNKLPVEKIWGIGPQTTIKLNQLKIYTAGEFANKPKGWVTSLFSKPFFEIWQELNGGFALPLNLLAKTSYASIQKFKTFTPPSSNPNFVFAQLSKNIENACIKLRRYNLAAPKMVIILRAQTFNHSVVELTLARPTNLPPEILPIAKKAFDEIYIPKRDYRATGVAMFNLIPYKLQPDLFGASKRAEKLSKLYAGADMVAAKYGKHTLFLGASWAANKFGNHLTSRGDDPERKQNLFLGETKRRRLNIPMLMGEVF